MSIEEELAPHIEYIVNEIASMKMFDKERAKLLLLMWFAQTTENVYKTRAEDMAAENAKNQQAIQTGRLSIKDKQFLTTQNIVFKEKRKENNRISSMGKNIKEYIQLKQFLKTKFGSKEAGLLMSEAMKFEIDITGLLKGQGFRNT